MSLVSLASAAHLTAAAVLGAMVFFSAIVAPLVFMRLPGEQAGMFIRALFPHYYLHLGIVSCIALTLALISGNWGGISLAALAAVCVGFGLARQWMMPAINRLRDASLNGDVRAGKRFKMWHFASVCLNAVQILALVGICLVGYSP